MLRGPQKSALPSGAVWGHNAGARSLHGIGTNGKQGGVGVCLGKRVGKNGQSAAAMDLQYGFICCGQAVLPQPDKVQRTLQEDAQNRTA